MRACLSTVAPTGDLLREAVDTYRAAFSQPPYDEPPEQAEAFGERVRTYAAERDGFRLATISRDDGRVDAIGLAVLAGPGDWWRDHVASTALDDTAVERWLGERCLEVVHVAVRPDVRGTGLGRLAHDLLLAGAPAPTAILACHPQYEPAYRLYTSSGWRLIGALPVPAGGPFRLMARDLRSVD